MKKIIIASKKVIKQIALFIIFVFICSILVNCDPIQLMDNTIKQLMPGSIIVL